MKCPVELIDAINKNRKFVVTSHCSPEADAVASAISLAELLKSLGKEAVVVLHDKVPSVLDFFAHLDEVVYLPELGSLEFDMLCVVDSGSIDRTCFFERGASLPGKILNIDHHVSNDNFGTVNWVLPNASSATILIDALYKEFGVEMQKEIAEMIYASLLTETGGFTYGNTNEYCLKVASSLVQAGASPHKISDLIYNSQPAGSVRLVGEVLRGLKVSDAGNIAWVVVEKRFYDATGTTAEDTDGIVNYTVSIKGVEVGVLFREIEADALYKVSMRSKGAVDVAQIAAGFDGGGHRQAAGCTVSGTKKEVIDTVLKSVSEMI